MSRNRFLSNATLIFWFGLNSLELGNENTEFYLVLTFHDAASWRCRRQPQNDFAMTHTDVYSLY